MNNTKPETSNVEYVGEVEYDLNFCRYCLKEEDLLEGVVPPEMFENILKVEIYRSINVPPFICYECKDRLASVEDFHKTIVDAQEALQRLDKNDDLKPNESTQLIPEQKPNNASIKIVDVTVIAAGSSVMQVETLHDDYYFDDEVLDDDASTASTASADEFENDLEDTLPSVAIETVPKLMKAELDGKVVDLVATPYKPVSRGVKNKLNATAAPGNRVKIKGIERYSHPPSVISTLTPEELKQWDADNARINQFYTFNCPICRSITFDSYAYYKFHMRKAHNRAAPDLYCCKRKLKNRSALLDHMNLHLNPSELTCPECGKVCREKYQLRYHMAYHRDPEGMKPFVCEICDKRFMQNSQLEYHLQTHMTPEEREKLRTFQCQKCSRAYTSQRMLNHHVRLAHEEAYAVCCNICGKKYLSKTALKYHHRETHTPDSSYLECPECQKKFLFQSRLNHHMKRVHCEEGDFKCEQCGKEAKTMYALQTHIKFVHEMIPKHKCSECGKGFKTPKRLKEHAAKHDGIPLYQCSFCHRQFNSNANMYNHRKRMHPTEHRLMIEKKKFKTK